jgi:predicted RNA methylase
MPGRDIFHQHVKTALIKDAWRITHDPLTVQFGTTDLFIDLGAEKLIAAEKAGRTIAVEIKSFLSSSVMSDFHRHLVSF